LRSKVLSNFLAPAHLRSSVVSLSGRCSSARSSSTRDRCPFRDQQLPDDVVPLVGQRPELRLPDFPGQRRHPAQHFAQRRAVVFRHPAPQREQFRVQNRLLVEQPQSFPRLHLRRLVVGFENHSGQLARPEWDDDPAARNGPVAQRFREAIGERTCQGHRQTDVDERKNRFPSVIFSPSAALFNVAGANL